VWVVDGGEAWRREIEDAASVTVGGDSSMDGTRSCAVVDLDGDGQSELVVGSASDQHTSGHTVDWDAGNLAIFRSDAEESTLDLQDSEFQISGDHEGAYLGWIVVPTDLDADGYGEVLVSAPGESAGGASAGAIYRVAGQADLAFAETIGDAAVATWVGTESNGLLGLFGIAAPGDNDGDGSLDLVFGEGRSGFVSWWSAAASETGLHNVRDGTGGWKFGGDQCGTAVVGDSDLDADGADDILVGCPSASGNEHRAGEVVRVVPSGEGVETEGFERASIQGSDPGASLGMMLWGGEDLTGDGVEDVLVGAPYDGTGGHYAGAVYLLPGMGPGE
jgi:hypothetical protein